MAKPRLAAGQPAQTILAARLPLIAQALHLASTAQPLSANDPQATQLSLETGSERPE